MLDLNVVVKYCMFDCLWAEALVGKGCCTLLLETPKTPPHISLLCHQLSDAGGFLLVEVRAYMRHVKGRVAPDFKTFFSSVLTKDNVLSRVSVLVFSSSEPREG